MGPSGSGKSTLMHCAAGLDEATSGRVFIGDAELTALNEKELTRLRRDRIGFIFQAFNLIPTLTAKENILLRCRRRSATRPGVVRPGHRHRRAARTAPHRPTGSPGGQQQRVACARALVSRPDIIFADEPPAISTPSPAARSSSSFAGRSPTSARPSMVTHDPTAASFTDRVLFLADGQVVDELRQPHRRACAERMGNPTAPRGLSHARASLKSLLARKLPA